MRAAEPRASTPPRPFWSSRSIGLIAVALAGVALLAFGGRAAVDALPRVLDAVRGAGPWAALAFVAVYAIATVAWIPGSILTLAAGAIFGPVLGTIYTLVGATLGAGLAFLVSRHVARAAVERRLGDSPRLRAIDEAVQKEGGRTVFLLRLSPIFPFNALNYALGLTSVRFRAYILASLIGMAPGTFAYVYAGWTASEIAAGASGAPRGPISYIMLAVGLAATIAVTVLVTRAARKALRRSGGLEA